MCKWWWKLEDGDGPRQDFMWKKYLRNPGVYYAACSQAKKIMLCGLICYISKISISVEGKCR
jgi:hypothetical protein